MNINDWMADHPEAFAWVMDWVEERRQGKTIIGVRKAISLLQDHFSFPFDTQPAFWRWLSSLGMAPPRTPVQKKALKVKLSDLSFVRTSEELAKLVGGVTHVVTAAVNNCNPAPFFYALKRYCRENNARLHVIPIRYQNPTSWRNPQEGREHEDYWWHKEFKPFMLEDELQIHPLLTVMGNVRIQATAPNPLNGLDSRSGAASAIYGATQLSMKTVATPQNVLPKILWSTGAVTEQNYSRTKSGDLAHFHHSHSAIIAEISGNKFFTREVTWSRTHQNFIDIDRLYAVKGPSKRHDGEWLVPPSVCAPRPEALYMGDTHEIVMDPVVRKATWGKGGLVDRYKPKRVIEGDIFDGRSINHHDAHLKLLQAVYSYQGHDSLEKELDSVVNYFSETYRPSVERIVTASNHDDFLNQWLQGGDMKVAPNNLLTYLELGAGVLREARDNGGDIPNAIEYYCRHRVPYVRFLRVDESLQVLGCELGMHGHLGPNGSRGNPRNLSTIGTRFIMGHLHGGGWCIFKGGYQAMTSTFLMLGYTKGPSSWLQGHVWLHGNGKRQTCILIDGEHRA